MLNGWERVYERVRRKGLANNCSAESRRYAVGGTHLRGARRRTRDSERKIARLKTVGLRPASLDAPISDEEQSALCENIPDDQSLTPFEFLSEKDFSEQINR